MNVSLLCFVKVSGGLEIISAHESQDDAEALASDDTGKVGAEKYKVVTLEVQPPQIVQGRADVLSVIDQVWPDCPPDVRNQLGGPVNACDWAGATFTETRAAVNLAKKEYMKKPWKVEDADKAGQRVQKQRKVNRRNYIQRRNLQK